jgi:hypothetical protein
MLEMKNSINQVKNTGSLIDETKQKKEHQLLKTKSRKHYIQTAIKKKQTNEKQGWHSGSNSRVPDTTDTDEIQRIREYFENLYSNKLVNLEEMDEFIDT